MSQVAPRRQRALRALQLNADLVHEYHVHAQAALGNAPALSRATKSPELEQARAVYARLAQAVDMTGDDLFETARVATGINIARHLRLDRTPPASPSTSVWPSANGPYTFAHQTAARRRCRYN